MDGKRRERFAIMICLVLRKGRERYRKPENKLGIETKGSVKVHVNHAPSN